MNLSGKMLNEIFTHRRADNESFRISHFIETGSEMVVARD